jgi:hypothetical protein
MVSVSLSLNTQKGSQERTCSFLEDGNSKDWYQKCKQEDRGKILAPFEVPAFLLSQTSAELNGYFGSRSSFKSESLPNNAATSTVDTLESLSKSNSTAKPR